MREIFGFRTDMSEHEEKVITAILKNNRIVRPEFIYKKPEINIKDTIKTETNEFSNSTQLNFFTNGIIIPFDLINLQITKFNNLSNNNTCKRTKYIGRPDFLFIEENNNNLTVFPIDIKTTQITNSIKNSSIKQISAFNLYHLYLYSDYLNKTLDFLSKQYNKKIIFTNGAFIINEINKHENLETFIRENIHNSIPEKFRNISNIGINFSIFPPSLMLGSEYPFISDTSFDIRRIKKETHLREYLKRIKSKIKIDGYYPNDVIVISGFNSQKKPIKRLEFIANEEINTFDPFIEILHDRIDEINSMSHIEIFQKYEETLFQSQEEKLQRLKYELEREEYKLNLYHEKSYNLKTRGYADSNSRQKIHENYRKKIIQISRQIDELNFDIQNTQTSIQTEKEAIYRKNNNLTEKELYIIGETKRDKLITKILTELENREKDLIRRQEKDTKLNNRIKMFNQISNQSISTEYYFKTPKEIYLQLGNSKIYKILTYSTLNLLN